jgi:hypothetical protein
MTYEIKSLAGRQLFWKTLFEEKMLAPQLATLATDHVDGITYDDIPKYGKLHVKVESGSTLGDNFQSDTFIVTARLMQRDGEDIPNNLSTFIKVTFNNSFGFGCISDANDFGNACLKFLSLQRRCCRRISYFGNQFTNHASIIGKSTCITISSIH